MPPDPVETSPAQRFRAALDAAGRRRGLDATGAEVLRLHGSGIYHLPRENLVGRVLPATEVDRRRITTALAVTTWLADRDFACIRPASGDLTEVGGCLVSFWHYLPQPPRTGRGPSTVMGTLLRELHALPRPPFTLPPVVPLARLERALARDATRPQPVLADAQRRYLEERVIQVGAAYDALEFPLGLGLIHNDAHVGNLLVDPRSPIGYVLGDWDGAGLGPRETDLVPEGAPGDRFGRTEEERRGFCTAYGYDLAHWPGWRTLRELRDIHALASHIRAAPAKPAARAELELRLASLMTGRRAPWRAVA